MLAKILSQILAFILVFIAVLLLVAALMALPLMLLWNWLMPVIFGLTTITFWQAFGLIFLCGLLFKNVNSSSK